LRFPESPPQHYSVHESHRIPLQPYTLQDHTHLSALALCTNASPLLPVYLTHTPSPPQRQRTQIFSCTSYTTASHETKKKVFSIERGSCETKSHPKYQKPKKLEARCGGRTDTKLETSPRKSTCRGRETYPATLRCRVSVISEYIRVSRSTD
jgi:hypothetical protein